jgi:6-pyruvoyltetrahydropterin/6-carboxytetrahydropterin synthase
MKEVAGRSSLLRISTERSFEAAHHNGPVTSHCHRVHGHSWTVRVQFTGQPDDLDQYGWLLDFGIIKKALDELLEAEYDHRDLNELMPVPSAEHLAIRFASQMYLKLGRMPSKVSISEGKGNTVEWVLHESEDNEG